ncbi:hypothetical protein SFR_6398 [Streptomyces sp. FR-008]|nr:hypothetical protein SFR_6398 [Streptomyces sp. FR-008]
MRHHLSVGHPGAGAKTRAPPTRRRSGGFGRAREPERAAPHGPSPRVTSRLAYVTLGTPLTEKWSVP